MLRADAVTVIKLFAEVGGSKNLQEEEFRTEIEPVRRGHKAA